MHALRKFLPVLAALACAALIDAAPTPAPTPSPYIPPAQYCALLGHLSTLCPVLPGNIGPDPELFVHRFGYNGLVGATPIKQQMGLIIGAGVAVSAIGEEGPRAKTVVGRCDSTADPLPLD